MAKNIVLCSDGTGNRWGVGNQTNVSRLYEAVATEGTGVRQIRFYDNGVGTSSNKYLKGFTGAFGFGLRKNVLDLYEFLARHWQPGDQIYLFGFSRGAATVRAFAGMLQECGLVWTEGDHPDCKCYDEERLVELMDLAKDAYRKRDPRDPEANRWYRESFWNSARASEGGFKVQKRVPIKMIGVWDTVSALGFPKGPRGPLRLLFAGAEELADRVFPHSFYNYRLDDRVELACHALAIDDERRTFRPMVWNEIDDPKPKRVEQVWFAGMHSDVGGGYARAGLASTALRWMMAHAVQEGLELRPQLIEEVDNKADSHGKLHNSRDGAAVYYRYMPRDLVRLCEKGLGWKGPGKVKRRISEDDKPKVPEGKVKIHRSALDRLHEGTARYAPGLLPRSFVVVEDPSPPPASPPWPLASPANPPSPLSVNAGADWETHRSDVLKWTYRRSVLYHVFLYVSVALAAWMLVRWIGGPEGETGATTVTQVVPGDWASQTTHAVFGRLEALLHWALPKATESFVSFVLVQKPLWLIGLLGLAAVLFGRRNQYFTARASSSQEARKQVLDGWARANGSRFSEKGLTGQADMRRLRLGPVLLRLLGIALAVVFTMGAFRITFAGSPAYETLARLAWTVALPILAFLVFKVLFRITGRKAGKNPLNMRRGGYKADDVGEDWSQRNLVAEKRFLLVDLFFPPVYGAAFAASFLLAFSGLGWPGWIGWGLAILVIVPVVADWVENFVHLKQLRRYLGEESGRAEEEGAGAHEVTRGRAALQEKWIAVASRATVIKLYGVYGAGGVVVALAFAMLVQAITQAYAEGGATAAFFFF